MNRYFKLILSLPKTLWVNIVIFGLKKGVRCPILIGHDVIIKEIHRGCIIIPENNRFAMIKIGFNHGTYGILEGNIKGFIKISKEAKIIFKGNADFKSGISLIATENGQIIIGDKFSCNRRCCISSNNLIEIGEDTIFGWNVHLRTSDGHPVYNINDLKKRINKNKPIIIGKHVWISANANILKGVTIPDYSIVGFNACVTKPFFENNCIIAGCPAEVIKNKVHWKR